jgi:8-oxo-dGTP pyrophosphatase MutT (NUDIX family)
MARIEHYNNPKAPKPNSIVAAVTAFVLDHQGRVLLIRRTDNGLWALPGGGQDFGEYIAETAVRETREETGITIEVTDIVGVYTNPNHLIEYSDGEVRQQFSICFRSRYVTGEPTTSDESSEVRWIANDQLNSLDINPSMRLRIDHGYEHRTKPHRVTGEKLLGPLHRLNGRRLSARPETRHQIIRTVPVPDLSQPVPHRQILTVRPRSHIRPPQRIRRLRPLSDELRGEHAPEPPFIGLELSAGMMSNKRGDPYGPSVVAKPAPTIEGMQPRPHHSQRVTDIVQPCRRHKGSTISLTEEHSDALRLPANGLHMPPPLRKRGCNLSPRKLSSPTR